MSFASNSGSWKLLCKAQAPVNVGGSNTLKVVSNNGTHTFSLNGKTVCTVRDTTYTVGPVMAAAYVASSTGQAYFLNNLTIQSLDSNATANGQAIDPEAYAPQTIPPGVSPAGVILPTVSSMIAP